MINFTYKHISKIIELTDIEIQRLETKRDKSLDSFSQTEIVADAQESERLRYDKEIDVLQEVKDRFLEVLNRVTFTFNANEPKVYPVEGEN